ncbi:hypothetical protein KSB_93230 [Ktedonobacter robiniae]|uniref:Uncharacterized protein n=1 Tax=Ktedonobacter robiniae TaxID=2778365 RepID=A0ABQ3V714_9CHLR|nr:hypothetical protein KSB_93230 [Ktedonobacter robiniae]
MESREIRGGWLLLCEPSGEGLRQVRHLVVKPGEKGKNLFWGKIHGAPI